MRPILMLLVCSLLAAEPPVWVGDPEALARLYPDQDWLVAYGLAEIKPGQESESRAKARAAALGELAQCLRVRVSASTSERWQETHRRDGRSDQGSATMSFASAVDLSSDLELPGAQVEDWLDARLGQVWALARCRRTALFDQASTDARLAQERLARLVQGAVGAASRDSVRNSWLAVQAECDRAESALSIALITSGGATRSGVVEGLSQVRRQRDEAMAALARLEGSPPATLAELAELLARRLDGVPAGTLRLATPTLGDSGFTSPCGLRLGRLLAARIAGQQVVDDPSVRAQHLLLVSLHPEAGRLRVQLRLRRTADGVLLRGTEAGMDLAAAEAEGPVLPVNFAQAAADRAIWEREAVAGSALRVQVLTDRPEEHPVFTEGQVTRLRVRVNREAWVRVVYHLADGQRAVLIDNHHIPADQANSLVELPGEFECSAPFGAEVVQAVAATVPLAPLRVRQQGGYALMLDDLATATAANRGLKLKQPKAELAECRLECSTLPKEKK